MIIMIIDHTNKWYRHNPAFVLENETQKLLWDFDIQMDHLILPRRPDFLVIKKMNLQKFWLWRSDWSRSKIERKWKEE